MLEHIIEPYCASKFAVRVLLKLLLWILENMVLEVNTIAPTKTINEKELFYKKRLAIIRNKIPSKSLLKKKI